MKNLLPSLLLSILGSLFSTLLLGNVYFVSPQGNDNNPGSQNAPDIGAVENTGKQGAYPQSFSPQGPGGGGFTYVPSISPHDPNHIFLNCDMGGVYRSQDGAQHWQLQHYSNLVSHVKGKIQFTADPNILYVCRRSTSNHEDPLFRGELAKSIDGGASWQPLADPTGSGVHRLEVDPASTQRLLLNEYDRLFFSSDGGANWSLVYQPPSGNMWIGGVFWDGANIYVGTNEGLLVSKNSGVSFSLENHAGLPSGTGIYQLSGAKSGATTRLFCLAVASDELFAWNEPLGVRGKLQGIFRMNYTSSASWTNSRGNIPSDVEIAWVDLALNNTQTVWAAGANSNSLPQIFKSTNGGQAWTNTYILDNNQNVSTGWAGDGGAFLLNYNESALGFDVSPTDPNMVIFSDGNGHISTDGGANWRATYVDPAFQNPAGQSTPIQKNYKSSGLDVTTAHHIFWVNDQEMFVCNTDIGQSYSADGGETWTFAHNFFQPWGTVSDNNWYHIIRQPSTGHLFAATSEINDMYLSYRISDETLDNQHGFVGKSTDNGASWDTIYNFGHPVVWLETDKINPAKLYASVVHSTEGGIFQSSDGGLSWSKLPNPPRTHGHPYNIVSLADGSLVATYSAHALSDGVTLTESSGVFLLPAGSNNWLDRTAATMKFYTKDLVIDPHDPTQNTWYATVWGRFTTFPGPNNQGNGGLYRTTNRGLSWTRIYANEMAESISIHPVQAGVAYLSAENDGLFYTENLGATPTFERVNSFPFWRPKRVFFKPGNSCELWVTTMGGGIWKATTSQPPLAGFSVSTDGLSAVFQNNSSNGLVYSWNFGDGQSSTEQNPTHNYGAPGSYTVVLTVSNGCGSQSSSMPVTADCNPPSVEIFTTGVTQICAGESVEIQVLGLNIASYAWFLNGIPVSGAAGSSFTATQSGIYKVYITDAAGCGNYSNEMSIEVSPLPEAVINSPSGGAVCAGASTWLNGTGGIAYQWLTPGGFQVSAQVIEIPAAGQANSGLYQLTVTAGSGCSATTSYSLTVNPLPLAAIQPSGTLSVPFGQNLVLDAGAGFAVYQWNSGESTQMLPVSACGAYQLTVTDANGCSATSPAVVVNIQPIAAFSNGVLLSTPAANYQWLLDGNPIAGANGPTYLPTLSGNYAVQTDCGALGAGLSVSPGVPVVISSVFDLHSGGRAYMRVSPNPLSTAATELLLDLYGFDAEPLVILVSDPLGREILRVEQPVFAEKIALKLEENAPGLYWVRVYGGGKLKAGCGLVRG